MSEVLFGGRKLKEGVESSNKGSKYRLLPKGNYPVTCESINLEYTKPDPVTGDVRGYFKAKFEVVDGEYVGVLFDDFYMADSSEAGLRSLGLFKQWFAAVGIKADEDQPVSPDMINSLVGKEFIAHVWIQKSKNPKFKDSNRIGKFELDPGAQPVNKKADTNTNYDEEIPF